MSETWIWLLIAVLFVVWFLTRNTPYNRVVGALGGLVFCGVALYRLNTVDFVASIPSCIASGSWECIPLVLGHAMPIPVFIGLGVLVIFELIVALWRLTRSV